jgi:predicted transcriptional regulator YdeE
LSYQDGEAWLLKSIMVCFARNKLMPLSRMLLLLVSILGASSLASLPLGENVSKQVVKQPFYVAGFQARTKNADEASGNGKIGPLWQRIFQDNLASRIPNRADAALTVVYSGYASDEKGDYDYLLGARVTSVDHLPEGMSWKKVEPGNYAVILTDTGEMPGVLQAAWQKIWRMPATEMGGKRAFVTDYEIYDARSADPKHAQVEIHIGLNPASN